ncbi:MAG: hypothetical protein EHM61_08685 [Acidobacteria bacterium]|nr:MAG: hypothetical protein EHM61_08685 [Acidobacteriota bacterium]
MRKLLFIVLVALLWGGSAALADECQGMHAAQEGAHDCGASCPEAGHEVVKTVADASLSGKVLCNHCDLHRGDTCQKVLQTADGKVYQFCPKTVKAEQLKNLSGKEVRVKGTIKELKDADAVLHVDSMEPVS